MSIARAAVFSLCLGLAACAGESDVFTPKPHPDADFPNIQYATWTEDEPPYVLFPGDELDLVVPSAPELNKTVTVQPDGRLNLALVGPVMVAGRSLSEAEGAISASYASQLLRPAVSLTARAAPLRVFVGGEVDKPGVYDMPGDINALQAIVMAGGFKTSAKRSEVVIIRRGPGGRPMMRTVNLIAGLTDPGRNELVPLRRFDVVYVPRTKISEAGVFVQQYFRDTMPVNLGFNYTFGPAAFLTGAN
ncbi:MAG TPA: polysaccharide biosynthesis/export family protein [Caulobacteraceae bacterium]|nr:polysaccharide biosynthesis/export family protein [Caulobacteraceae bacterium]